MDGIEQDLIYAGVPIDFSIMSVDNAEERMTEEEFDRMVREKYNLRSEHKRYQQGSRLLAKRSK